MILPWLCNSIRSPYYMIPYLLIGTYVMWPRFATHIIRHPVYSNTSWKIKKKWMYFLLSTQTRIRNLRPPGNAYVRLTHCGQVAHLCVSKLEYLWFRQWLGACLAPSRNNAGTVSNGSLTPVRFHSNSHKKIFKNASESVVYILS